MSLIFGCSYKGWNYHGEDRPLAMHATIDFILTHAASCILISLILLFTGNMELIHVG
jgi:hypothetical protein